MKVRINIPDKPTITLNESSKEWFEKVLSLWERNGEIIDVEIIDVMEWGEDVVKLAVQVFPKEWFEKVTPFDEWYEEKFYHTIIAWDRAKAAYHKKNTKVGWDGAIALTKECKDES